MNDSAEPGVAALNARRNTPVVLNEQVGVSCCLEHAADYADFLSPPLLGNALGLVPLNRRQLERIPALPGRQVERLHFLRLDMPFECVFCTCACVFRTRRLRVVSAL